MALEAGDWTVTRSSGNIRYTGDDHHEASPSYATVIQFHRWLQDLADDAVASGDDQLDITNTDPSRRSTDNIITLINGYNITDTEAEHLYDGSIIQNGGNDIYDGIVNFGNADVQIQILQSGLVVTDDWWNYGGGGLNPDVNGGISHRFMVQTRIGGVDIANRALIGTCRRYGYTYSEFKINSTARGNNVLALSDTADLNNVTASGVVDGWTTIVNQNEGYIGIDVNNDTTDEYYYSRWTRAAYTINQFYERLKFLSRDTSTDGLGQETLYGLDGEQFRGITHQVALSAGAGTWVEPESLSWGSGATAGTGQLLAVDNTTGSSSTKLWMQLLTGVVPNANTITGNGGATATAGTVTERAIATPFVGQSTGSAIIGSYGLGILETDLTQSDSVTDLDGNPYSPPNYVTNTVASMEIGDRVLVAPWDGVSTDTNNDPEIDKGQMLLSTALVASGITEVVVKNGTETAIPSDTPSSGYIRVADDNGFERRLHYDSYTGTTFSIDVDDANSNFSSVNASVDNNVYVAYLDEATAGTSSQYTAVYSSARDLVALVRQGTTDPIKQFISGWSFTGSNQTLNAIRTTDQ
jgi:hypothetical protein